MIEKLDGTTGDYHPHRIGEKVNEIIDKYNQLEDLVGRSFLAVFNELESINKKELE